MEVHISYLILAALVGVIIPIYSVIGGGQKVREILLESPEMKVMVYQQSIIFQWVMTALILGALAFNGDSVDRIGLVFLRHPLWVIGLILAGIAGLWLFRQVEIPPINIEKFRKRNQGVLYLLPITERDYRWAMALSLTAGICEEIIFRGFLFWQLHQFLPLIPSILIVNVLFALSHFATKMKNVVLAFVFGVVCSATFIWTNSLWLAMLLHMLVDFYSLTRGKQYFEKVGPPPEDSESEGLLPE